MQDTTRPAAAAKADAFQWEDPFLFDQMLTDEERLIADTARSFAQDRLAPRVTKAFMEETTDREIFNEMGSLGLLGVNIPAEYGGAGANYVSYGVLAREIERVDSGYRSMISVQSSLVMYPIYAFGSEAQIPSQTGIRRMGRLLRPDRARCRLRSCRHEDARREGGRRLQADRQQDVDFKLPHGRCVCPVGEVCRA